MKAELPLINRRREKILSISKNDFEIQAIRAGGKGGQKQNKTSSAIRMTHRDSGVSVVARDARSQKANMRQAFSRLLKTDKFQAWLKIEISRRNGLLAKIEDTVDSQMSEHNIRTEIRVNDSWVDINTQEQ